MLIYPNIIKGSLNLKYPKFRGLHVIFYIKILFIIIIIYIITYIPIYNKNMLKKSLNYY